MFSYSRFFSLLLVWTLSVLGSHAFVNNNVASRPLGLSTSTSPILTDSALSERRWNFNDGQAPWGMKKNAEIWNGRVSQMAFVWIFLQELVTGKGVIKGIEEGDVFFLANFALFSVCVVGLTGYLALQGDDDYTVES